MMNILLIITAIFFVFSVVLGMRRGFLRSLTILGTSVAAVILTLLLLDTVQTQVCARTNLEERIASGLQGRIEEALPQEMTTEPGELPVLQQAALIEEINLPQTLKNKLTENNYTAMYEFLGVSTFVDYVTHYMARILVRILCFVVCFLVLNLLLRLIFRTLNQAVRLPLLAGINRILGAFTGAASAILIIWIFFLLLTPLCTTGFGAWCFGQIDASQILGWLYERNLLLTFLTALG